MSKKRLIKKMLIFLRLKIEETWEILLVLLSCLLVAIFLPLITNIKLSELGLIMLTIFFIIGIGYLFYVVLIDFIKDNWKKAENELRKIEGK